MRVWVRVVSPSSWWERIQSSSSVGTADDGGSGGNRVWGDLETWDSGSGVQSSGMCAGDEWCSLSKTK